MSEINRDYVLRQMFDRESYTYTYILADTVSHEAVIIDPVFEQVDRDLKIIDQLGLKLKYVMNTHVHADHITGTGIMKKILGRGVKSVISESSEANADLKIKDGDVLHIGRLGLEVLSTPGHTTGCITYVFHRGRMAFTGDTLLIGGCGRTDMQGGCPVTLYYSVYQKIYRLPEDYVVYPAHDYKGRTCSTIKEEKLFNARLNLPLMEFIGAMKEIALKLGPPKLLQVAVPANRACGLYDLPKDMKDKLMSTKRKSS